MAHIDYYLSTLSPYVYLSGTRPGEVAAARGASISYKPLDIVALFSRTGGTSPKDRHPSRQAYRAQELDRQSRALGMPFNIAPAHWPTNPAPSCYAIIAAQSAGGGDVGKLVADFGRACWAEERDIAEDAVVREMLEGAGFDPGLADSGLLSGAETYARNLEDAVSAGAFGAPFFVLDDGALFWGQDRIADMDAHLAAGG